MSASSLVHFGFVHLRAHSEYSVINGISRVADIARHAQEHTSPAVALTDHNNIFAAIKFYLQCHKAKVKPIIGADISLHDDDNPLVRSVVTLLACSLAGFKSLAQLINIAQKQGAVSYQDLANLNEGLLLLSGSFGYAATLFATSEKQLGHHFERCHSLFGNRFYIAIERIGAKNEEAFNTQALTIAANQNIPIVATNGSYFNTATDYEMHEVRVCINSGYIVHDDKRPKQHSKEQYLKTTAAMQELFADLPVALANSVEIAKRCNLEFEIFTNRLPTFPLPAGFTNTNEYFVRKIEQGFKERLPHLSDAQRKQYQARAATEIEVIQKQDFVGYFLIVMEFIQWAKSEHIPVGPGRGSGAGSLVAYALYITDIDPIAHGLLFERFLNPERKSMPDFDIDFCINGRDAVIDHVKDLYGIDAVAQIATFGSLAAKAVIRDVARVLGYPFSFGDALVQFIPARPLDIKLQEAIDQDPNMQAFINNNEGAQAIVQTALRLEGLVRNVGTHAGGVVIAPSALYNYTALYFDDRGGQSTQFDKYDLETCGIIKFDFLGLKTLTVIDQALTLINQQTGKNITVDDIDIHDPSIYSLIATGSTTGIFQLESEGMRRLIRRIAPDCFSDIVALVALYRPGPLGSGMIDDFIDVKHGNKQASYLLPELEPILQETYGIILYQEQVMQIAQKLAHYSMGEADILRRAMGKKDTALMDRERQKFCTQAKEISTKNAQTIFDLMAEFANYGFNKSHSVAYAVIACQTAWLKAKHAMCFMVASFNCDIEKNDQIAITYKEAISIGIDVKPPSVNESDYLFTISKQQKNTIHYGLGGIKGVGKKVAQAIMQERQTSGAFSDFVDFCMRVPASGDFNKKTVDALIDAGALDGLGYGRAVMASATEEILKAARKQQEHARTGQQDLFVLDDTQPLFDKQDVAGFLHKNDVWLPEEELFREHKTLGIYVSNHPMNLYEEERQLLKWHTPADMPNFTGEQCVLAGIIQDTFKRVTPNMHHALFLEDGTRQQEVLVSAELFEAHRSLLKKYQPLVVKAQTNRAGEEKRVRINALTIEHMHDTCAQLVLHVVLQGQDLQSVMDLLTRYKQPHGALVVLASKQEHATGLFALPNNWRVAAEARRALDMHKGVQVCWRQAHWLDEQKANSGFVADT